MIYTSAKWGGWGLMFQGKRERKRPARLRQLHNKTAALVEQSSHKLHNVHKDGGCGKSSLAIHTNLHKLYK
jgi:hypothetical protein